MPFRLRRERAGRPDLSNSRDFYKGRTGRTAEKTAAPERPVSGLRTGESGGSGESGSLETSILRFHVLANSDSEEDQNVKKKVRNALAEYLETLLAPKTASKEKSDLQHTEQLVEAHLSDLEEKAEQVLKENGCTYGAEARLLKRNFPEKQYGDSIFPAGTYHTLQISLGEGSGHNWWCLLFPFGNMRDCVRGVFPEEQKEELKEILTEEEYESLFRWETASFQVKWKCLSK